jgi:hypothetical protein
MQVSFLWRALAASVVALGLAACSDSGEVGNVATTPVTTPTPVAGTVATGAPLANASVSLLCNAGGTPVTATTNAAGKYTGTLPVGCAGPYIFKATGVDSTVTPTAAITLYGFADANKNINITPVTDIAARVVTTGDPAAAYAAVAGGSKKVADYWNVAAGADARAKLTSLMAQMNISIAGLADLLHQPFNATAGDALDNVLEAIKLERGGVSLAALAELVAKNGGTPENKPWDALFPPGVNTLALNAVNCTLTPSTGNPATVTSAVVNITRSGSTIAFHIVPNVANTTTTFNPIVVADASSDNSDFRLSAQFGTRTFVNPSIYTSIFNASSASIDFFSNEFEVPTPVTYEQKFQANFYEIANGNTSFTCSKVINPILRSALFNFQPQARLSSLMSGTPTQIVASPANAPCSNFGPPAFTYTYAVSALGDLKVNNQSVPANWLDSGSFPFAFYNEEISFQAAVPNNYRIRMDANTDTGAIVSRSNRAQPTPFFGHTCSFNNN